MEHLFTYLEYRDYLRDCFEERKNRHAWFSYRYIGSKTGVDASFLVKVIQKQMHLADRSIRPMAAFLGLQENENTYFETLVHFNKAKRASDIRLYFEKLLLLRTPYSSALEKEKYEFFSTWYNVALYELISFFPCRLCDVPLLARILNPPITAAQCRRAIEVLQKLDMVRTEPDGTLRHVEAVVSTGEGWRSVAIHNYQKSVLDLGLRALESTPVAQRDISTLTMSLSRRSLETIRERLREIRKEFIEIARCESGAEEVYQLNLELFPLSCAATIDGPFKEGRDRQ